MALRQQGTGAFPAFLIAALVSACLAVGWAELGAPSQAQLATARRPCPT